MLCPQRGGMASFLRFYLFSSTGITVNESLTEVVMFLFYILIITSSFIDYLVLCCSRINALLSVLMKVKARWVMLFDG